MPLPKRTTYTAEDYWSLPDGENWVEPDISVICDKNKLTDRGCSGAPDFIKGVMEDGFRIETRGKKKGEKVFPSAGTKSRIKSICVKLAFSAFSVFCG